MYYYGLLEDLPSAAGSTYTIAANAGSYALTGTAVSVLHKWIVGASAGSYSVTGATATPRHAWKVSANAGSYALTGSDVSLIASTVVRVDRGGDGFSSSGGNDSRRKRRHRAYLEEKARLQRKADETEAKAAKAEAKVQRLEKKPVVTKADEFKIDEALVAAEEALLEAKAAADALEAHRMEVDEDDEEVMKMLKRIIELHWQDF